MYISTDRRYSLRYSLVICNFYFSKRQQPPRHIFLVYLWVTAFSDFHFYTKFLAKWAIWNKRSAFCLGRTDTDDRIEKLARAISHFLVLLFQFIDDTKYAIRWISTVQPSLIHHEPLVIRDKVLPTTSLLAARFTVSNYVDTRVLFARWFMRTSRNRASVKVFLLFFIQTYFLSPPRHSVCRRQEWTNRPLSNVSLYTVTEGFTWRKTGQIHDTHRSRNAKNNGSDIHTITTLRRSATRRCVPTARSSIIHRFSITWLLVSRQTPPFSRLRL